MNQAPKNNLKKLGEPAVTIAWLVFMSLFVFLILASIFDFHLNTHASYAMRIGLGITVSSLAIFYSVKENKRNKATIYNRLELIVLCISCFLFYIWIALLLLRLLIPLPMPEWLNLVAFLSFMPGMYFLTKSNGRKQRYL